jgi:hypothetical protein
MRKIDLESINNRYVLAYDKWYRMCAGLATRLEDYENKTLHLKISVQPKWMKDPVTTSRLMAGKWRKYIPELKHAQHYRVCYNFGSVGKYDPEAKPLQIWIEGDIDDPIDENYWFGEQTTK